MSHVMIGRSAGDAYVLFGGFEVEVFGCSVFLVVSSAGFEEESDAFRFFSLLLRRMIIIVAVTIVIVASSPFGNSFPDIPSCLLQGYGAHGMTIVIQHEHIVIHWRFHRYEFFLGFEPPFFFNFATNVRWDIFFGYAELG